MKWTIRYHSGVKEDLESIGPSTARRIMLAIDAKLTKVPMEFGVAISGIFSEFRKLRIEDYRAVCQVQDRQVMVFFLP